MGKTFSSSQYATGSCNILSTALPHKIPFILQKALSDGLFFALDRTVQSHPELYLYQTSVASHLLLSEATTLPAISDSQKTTHPKKALFSGFLG